MYWVGMAKNDCGQSGHGALKIDFISKINTWNKLIFLPAGANIGKLKAHSIIFEWSWSKISVAF